MAASGEVALFTSEMLFVHCMNEKGNFLLENTDFLSVITMIVC